MWLNQIENWERVCGCGCACVWVYSCECKFANEIVIVWVYQRGRETAWVGESLSIAKNAKLDELGDMGWWVWELMEGKTLRSLSNPLPANNATNAFWCLLADTGSAGGKGKCWSKYCPVLLRLRCLVLTFFYLLQRKKTTIYFKRPSSMTLLSWVLEYLLNCYLMTII